jgi:hypothetical protein
MQKLSVVVNWFQKAKLKVTEVVPFLLLNNQCVGWKQLKLHPRSERCKVLTRVAAILAANLLLRLKRKKGKFGREKRTKKRRKRRRTRRRKRIKGSIRMFFI